MAALACDLLASDVHTKVLQTVHDHIVTRVVFVNLYHHL